ncbi:MAG TPA: FtsX-like permease family protein [Flavobacterium sp.]|uniref:ABC transporter permease n=1 Tax=Flavobacterium sp. TaxID=239 RepID=UPI002BFDF40E|nr:FtsX-like permease family protein [Flavobacterium sp.]HSD13062.1 FtsX-like permease family protein [Flavobacterium sp.]
MIGKLAWRNTWFKPLSTILSIILLMSSVAIITVLILLQKQFEEQFSSNADDIDLVLGAQGSPLQLVLSSVYQMDAPTGNIDYLEAKTWMQNPFVKSAIPLAYGDNYLGFKIIGTTPDYLAKFGGKIEKGAMFSKTFEVVIGSEIASKLQLTVGDTFFGSHGDAKEGEKHEEGAYKVVGIASKTGKVVDNLILSNIQSVWSMHDVHDHEEGEANHEASINSEEGKEITAVLIKFRNKMGIVLWPRLIAQNTKMQAASPAIEINRLFTLFGIGLEALQYLAYGIMLISGISIFIALFNTLKERKYEFALLRIQGASRLQLLQAIIIESLVLCVIGFVFGTILGRIALVFISNSSDEEFKIAFNPLEFVWEKEGILFLVTIFVGLLAAFIPAIKAYRLNISKTLSNA